jgi:hypothetical protein
MVNALFVGIAAAAAYVLFSCYGNVLSVCLRVLSSSLTEAITVFTCSSLDLVLFSTSSDTTWYPFAPRVLITPRAS